MLRDLLYQTAMVMVSKNKEMKALYTYLNLKTRSENSLENKQALAVITRKVIKILFTLVKKKEEYDAKKFLGSFREAQLQDA